MRVARRAGNQQANTATATSTSGAKTNVRRSSVVTPYRKLSSTRLDAAAASRPATAPVAIRRGPLPHDQADDVAPLRAERHPDANLPAALGDGVAEEAVDAERREHQRQGREEPDATGVEARLGDRGG